MRCVIQRRKDGDEEGWFSINYGYIGDGIGLGEGSKRVRRWLQEGELSGSGLW